MEDDKKQDGHSHYQNWMMNPWEFIIPVSLLLCTFKIFMIKHLKIPASIILKQRLKIIFEIPLSYKRSQSSLRRAGQGKYQISPEHLVMPEDEEALKKKKMVEEEKRPRRQLEIAPNGHSQNNLSKTNNGSIGTQPKE